MTELLYLPNDDQTTSFTATIVDGTDEYIVLDGTYFYPKGGGQPADHGRIDWADGYAIIGDVRKDHGDVHHVIESLEGSLPQERESVQAEIDAERRGQLTRMHTAQHVVSRVVLDEYGASTAGNQVYPDRSRIDFESASFDESDIRKIEQLSNEAIERDLTEATVTWDGEQRYELTPQDTNVGQGSLVVPDPEVSGEVDSLVQTHDLPVTILDLLGLGAEARNMDGQSTVSLLTGEQGTWSYLRHPEEQTDELYHVEQDPQERTNRIETDTDTVVRDSLPL